MVKIGCSRCGKEYGTNPKCLCWDLRRTPVPKRPFFFEPGRLKEAQMREGTWFVERWYKTCMKCDLSVGDEDASYCPNCGKWLGSVRSHVSFFALLSFGSFIAATGFAFGAYLTGGRNPSFQILAVICAGICLGMLYSIKPFGEHLVRLEGKKRRAEEWNAEVEKRRREAEEDRTERERSANAKAESGINIRFNAVDRERVREMLKGHMDRFSIGFKKSGMEEFPLLRGWPSPSNEKLGTIRTNKEQWLADIIEAGVSLGWHKNAEGEVESFFLEPLPAKPTKEFKYSGQVLRWLAGHDDDDQLYYDAASPYHHHGSPFMFRIRMEKSTRLWYLDHDDELMNQEDEEARFKTLEAAMMHCEVARSEIVLEEARKEKKITFTTVQCGLEKFTDIGCSCGREHNVSHLRNDFICPCGKRYVNTSEGWRPEPRCRFFLGSVGCGLRATARLHCDKTLDGCRKLGNEERFAP
jgi:hypothetical protein